MPHYWGVAAYMNMKNMVPERECMKHLKARALYVGNEGYNVFLGRRHDAFDGSEIRAYASPVQPRATRTIYKSRKHSFIH